MEKTKKKKTKKKSEQPEAIEPEVMAAEEEPAQPDKEQTAEAQSAEGQAPAQEAAAAQPRTPEDEALESRLLRLQADFDNYRRRTLRERTEWQVKANEELLRDLLPVIDHYELGLKTAEKHQTDSSVIDGFKMVYDQFLAALRKCQVAPIEAEGKPFDHNLHEAITYVPSEEHPAETVIAETRRGYLIGDRLLRPAQVVVSSGSAEAGGQDKETEQ